MVGAWLRQAPNVAFDDTVQGTDDAPAGAGGVDGRQR